MSLAFDIREAIALQLRQNIRGLQAQPYVMANPSPPSADVRRGPVNYDEAFGGGTHRWEMLVRVFVAGATDRGAQARLDAYLAPDGDRSVKAAIESDPTLGGLISDLHVTDASGEQTYTVTGSVEPLIGSEWTVEVWL